MDLTRLKALIGRRVRYTVTLGGILFLLALTLTGAAAFLSGNNLLFLIFAAMMALLLVSGFLSRLVLAGLEIELLLPEHVSARVPTPARIRLRNLKRLTPSFSIELTGLAPANAASILTKSIYFPLISGGATIEAPIEVVFPARGPHRDNLFRLSTHFPFGFLRKSTSVTLRRDTIVYPSLQPQPAVELLLAEIAAESDARARGGTRDFFGIRPFDPGDNARHVDWKSTARTGTLQVREFATHHNPTVEIRLNRQISPDQLSAFEDLIERCAFLSWHLTARGTPLMFRAGPGDMIFADISDIYEILRFLALVEPSFGSDLASSQEFTTLPPDPANVLVVFSAPDRTLELRG